jgi:hypothetical protein
MSIRDEIEAWHLRNTKPITYGAVSSSPSQDMRFSGSGGRIPSAGPMGGPMGFPGGMGGMGFPGGAPPGGWGWGPVAGSGMPGPYTPMGTLTGRVPPSMVADQPAGSGRQCAPGDWKCLAEANSPGRNRIA